MSIDWSKRKQVLRVGSSPSSLMNQVLLHKGTPNPMAEMTDTMSVLQLAFAIVVDHAIGRDFKQELHRCTCGSRTRVFYTTRYGSYCDECISAVTKYMEQTPLGMECFERRRKWLDS